MKRRTALQGLLGFVAGLVVGLPPKRAVAALPVAVVPKVRRLVWDRTTEKGPEKLLEPWLAMFEAGTLPDTATIRYEKPDGTLWGELAEPPSFAPKDWVWRGEVRQDFLLLTWTYHKLRMGHLRSLSPKTSRANPACMPQLPEPEKLPRVVIEMPWVDSTRERPYGLEASAPWHQGTVERAFWEEDPQIFFSAIADHVAATGIGIVPAYNPNERTVGFMTTSGSCYWKIPLTRFKDRMRQQTVRHLGGKRGALRLAEALSAGRDIWS